MKENELPDFDILFDLTAEIGKLKRDILLDEARLDQLLAEITEAVTTDPNYFINDKIPSMSYIKSYYHVAGINDKTAKVLKEVKERIAINKGELKNKELLFQVYRDMISVWRTTSANKRYT